MRTTPMTGVLYAFVNYSTRSFKYSVSFLIAFSLFYQIGVAQTYTVRSNADNVPLNGGNPDFGLCGNYNTLPLAQRTLRFAIVCANGNVGNQTINFNLGAGQETIVLTPQALPGNYWQGPLGMNTQYTIDGINTAGSGTQVTIDGNGLEIFSIANWNGGNPATNSVYRNLSLTNGTYGFNIGDQVANANILIEDVEIYGNSLHGAIINGANGITIRNSHIYGNLQNGIQLNDLEDATIQGNMIGTNAAGTACSAGAVEYGNQYDGIQLINVSQSLVGGTTAGTRNVVSCNGINEPVSTTSGKRGIYLQDAFDNVLIGNHIGTGVTGNETGMGNWTNGVLLTGTGATPGSYDNVLGGSGDSANVIGNNGRHPKDVLVPNSLSQHGLVIVESNSYGNKINGNYIGLGRDGTTDLGNKLNGIEIGKDAHDNFIGGTGTGQGNYVANNGNIGIVAQSGADDNVIQNNYIGLDINGDPAGNASHGIQLSTYNPGEPTAPYNAPLPIEGNSILNNVISGNGVGGPDVEPGTVGSGIHAGGDGPPIDGIIIQGNLIGLAPDGTAASAAYANAGDGILLETELTGIQIGGTNPGEGNVVSNNGHHGINVAPTTVSTTGVGNAIIGNYVGVEADGLTAAGNGIIPVPTAYGNGINVQGSVEGLVIGGASAGARNIVANNLDNGIYLTSNPADVTHTPSNITVYNNYVGFDVDGNVAGNATSGNGSGIGVIAGTNISIGGTTAGTGNFIAGNGVANNDGILISGGSGIGVYNNNIGTNILGTLGGATFANQGHGINVIGGGNVTIGSDGAGNLISGNALNGIEISGGDTITIVDNTIGLDDAETGAIANGQNGIYVSGGDSIVIGSATSENVISGNTLNGVQFNASSGDVYLLGNYIGTDGSGNSAIGNGPTHSGVLITSSSSNITFGGSNAGEGNVISGNNLHGVEISNNSSVVNFEGNYIGLGEDGSTALGNSGDGVDVSESTGITIGGTTTASANVISSNGTPGDNTTGNGINFWNVSDATIQNNTIGLSASNNADRGNTNHGININGDNATASEGHTIANNTIAANEARGIGLYGAANDGAIVGNNFGFGTPIISANFPNVSQDILVNGASNFTIGGGLGSAQSNVFGGTTEVNIEISGASSDIDVVGNFIGLDATQSATRTATNNAIIVAGTVSGVEIGGAADSGNVVMLTNVANAALSIQGGTGTAVDGNYFGVTQSSGGANTLTSTFAHAIEVSGATLTDIGSVQGNTMPDARDHAIHLFSGADNTTIANNNIGFNDAGESAGTAIEGNGVFVDGVQGTTITGNAIGSVLNAANAGIFIEDVNSGTTAIDGNLVGITRGDLDGNISGDGIYIQRSASAINIGTTTGNLIAYNDDNGIEIVDASMVDVEQNIIGVTSNFGMAAANNNGILISGGSSDIDIQNDNVISGNTFAGVEVTNSGADIDIDGNAFGVNGDSTATINNAAYNILVDATDNVDITNNVLAGSVQGVYINNGANGTAITDNFIGTTDAAGTNNLAASFAGITIEDGNSTDIQRNVIAYSSSDGVVVNAGGANSIIDNSMFCNDQTTAGAGGAPNVDGTGITLNGGNNNFLNNLPGDQLSEIRPLVKPLQGEMVISFGAGSNASSISGLNGSTVHIYAYDDNCENCQPRYNTGVSVTLNGTHFAAGAADTTVTFPIPGTIDPSANTYVVIITDAFGNSSQVSGCSEIGCVAPTAAFTTFPGTGDLVADSLLVLCDGVATTESLVATDDAGYTEYIKWFSIDAAGDTSVVSEGSEQLSYDAPVPAVGDTAGYVFLTYPDNFKECYEVSDTLYITSIPNVEVEIDADQVLCEDSIYTLSADTVRNWSTFDWTVSAGATGIFSSATDALHPSYTVGDADLGTVTITLDATGLLPSRGAACGTETISMDITTHQRPEVDAGDDIITICPGSTLDLTSIATPSSESNTTSIAWTDSIGTGEANGSFSSPSTIATDYTVAVQDSGQTVRLVVTGTGNAVCPVAQDFLDITVKDSTRFIIPISDTTICDVTTLDLAGIGTYNTKNDDNYIWSVTPNEGTLTTSTSARPTYTPAATPSASVVLTADVTGTAPTHGSGTCHVAQDQVTVNINPTPTVEAGTLPATQCSGTNVVLGTGASATGTDSFTWSHDGSGSWQGGDNTILAAVYVPDAIADAGNTVTFTLNGVSSCGNPTDNVSIDLLASPSSEAGDNGVICEGSTFTTVGSSAANGAVNRTWMLDNPRTGTVGGGAGTFTATNNDITTYTPDASDYGKTIYLFLEAEGPVAGTCQFVYDSLALTINEQATVADMPDQAVCLGDVISFGSLSPAASATNYTSIAWSGGQPSGWTIPAGDTLNATYEPLLADGASTTVTLTVTALPQCTDVSDDVAITIGQAPQVTLNPATLCEDGTQSVSALIASEANTTGASTYTWTPAADVSGDTYTPPTGSGGTTQTLTLEVTEPSAPAACQTRTFTVDLQIDALPTLTIGGPYQMCIDESFTIPATDIVVNPSSLALTWVASGNAGSNTNETYTSVAADAGNTVTMTATTADNGTCSGVSAFTQLEVYGLPTPSIFGSSDVCANQVSSFTMPSAPAASSYVWSVTQGLSQSTTTTLQPGDGVDIDFTGATGQVTVTVEMTDQFGCVNTASLPIDVTESFIPEFEINEPQGCTGDNMTFNLTNIVPNSANNSFAWYLNDDTGTPLQTGNGTTLTINTLQPGDRIIVNYTVDPLLNCADATTPSSNYTEWSNPDINIRPATPVLTGGVVVCAPLATTASADVAGSRMEWYINNDATPLAVGQNFDEVLSEGAYTLRYEVANGPCAASSTIQAVVDRAQVTASATSDDLEEGEFTVLSSKHNTLNQSYVYNWENLSHDEVIPAFNQKNDVVVYPTESTTTYRVTATTSNGCEATDDVDINVFVFCEPENVFTPNGDDVNDTWNLDCLNDGSFPQAVVTIYNRWGDVVYKDDRGYIEPWDGTRNGEPMPVATYWYVIEFNVRGKVLHGSVTILR